ncbi:MAG: tetratricopeptide repeat protein, partial [Methanothrix sp.]|nr:tetratricopeptide repeat protein [Methanothrix sp.]
MKRTIECWLVLILILFCPQCMVVYGQESTAVYWFDKGNEFLEDRSYEKAIDNYDNAIEIDRRFSEAWVAKGIALVGLEKYNESIDCFDEAIKINPEYAEAWHNKGLALAIGLGRYEEAI